MVSLGAQVAIFSILVFILTLCGVLTPRFFQPASDVIMYINLMAGGVLFSAATVHFLPDGSLLLDHTLARDSSGAPYPWSFFFAAITFYFMFLLDRIIPELYLLWKEDRITQQPVVTPVDTQTTSTITNTMSGTAGLQSLNESDASIEPNPLESTQLIEPVETEESVKITLSEKQTVQPPEMQLNAEDVAHREVANLVSDGDYMTAGVLMCGLGIHSALEGLALGDASNSKALLSVAIAVLGHKYLEGIAIGVPLHSGGLDFKKHALAGALYSIITPLGALAGYLVGQAGGDSVSGLLLSLTSGTFFFVSIVEIMLPAFEDQDDVKPEGGKKRVVDDLKKGCALLGGFGLMSLIGVWA